MDTESLPFLVPPGDSAHAATPAQPTAAAQGSPRAPVRGPCVLGPSLEFPSPRPTWLSTVATNRASTPRPGGAKFRIPRVSCEGLGKRPCCVSSVENRDQQPPLPPHAGH